MLQSLLLIFCMLWAEYLSHKKDVQLIRCFYLHIQNFTNDCIRRMVSILNTVIIGRVDHVVNWDPRKGCWPRWDWFWNFVYLRKAFDVPVHRPSVWGIVRSSDMSEYMRIMQSLYKVDQKDNLVNGLGHHWSCAKTVAVPPSHRLDRQRWAINSNRYGITFCG